MSQQETDFLVVNHGSLVMLTPLTQAAKDWCEEHLPEDRQYFGRGVVVEPRYIGDIVDGIVNDGLVVAS